MRIDGLQVPDPERLAIALRWRDEGTMSESAYLIWAMAEAGVPQRSIADHVERSKGTVSDVLRHWRRRIEEELRGQADQVA